MVDRVTDYFSILGVERDATDEQVDTAFLKKSKEMHPDRLIGPDTTPEQADLINKRYQVISQAFTVLKTDAGRRMYRDTLTHTHADLRGAQRDIGYQKPSQFLTSTGSFDKDTFHSQFARDNDEAFRKLQDQYNKQDKVRTSDVERLLVDRQSQMASLHDERLAQSLGAGQSFDRSAFNLLFEEQKKRNPGTGIETYTGQPSGMFSSGGLAEDDRFSGLTLGNGFNFTNQTSIDNMVGGFVPGLADVDISQYRGRTIEQESRLTRFDMNAQLEAHRADRMRLAGMQRDQFVVEETEIERMYKGLFRPGNVEGLEAPKHF